MKNLITITGDYNSSNATFEGTKKEVLEFLKKEALTMRKQSRELRRLPNTVHAINNDLHQSKLVTMASFAIEKLGAENLIELMNSHGVFKYEMS